MRSDEAMEQTHMIAILSAAMVVLFLLGVILVVWNPIEEKIPNARIQIDGEGDSIVMHHLSGDEFSKDRLVVKVNGIIIPNDNMQFISGIWPWSAGENINFYSPAVGSERIVEIYYLNNKNEQMLIDKERIAEPPVVSATPLPVEVIITNTPIPGPSTIPVEVLDVKADQPPVADFTADERLGDPPFTVTFSDLTYGTGNSYLWTFGDGSTSTLQNPVHTYFVPGSYTVSLLVSNSYGSNRKTMDDYIVIGSPPVASYLTEPVSGQAPLTVQFTDLSTGNPKDWQWSFSDGTTSDEKNPVHIFQDAGNYTVTMTVTNSYGTSKYTSEQVIKVTSPTSMDVFLQNSRNAYLEPEGYVRFRVTDPASSLKVAGKSYRFVPGDMLQLILGTGSSDGTISSDKNQFVAFDFDDVTVVNNGEIIGRGPVKSLRIGGFDSFSSTLNLTIPAGDQYDVLYIDEKLHKYVTAPIMRFTSIGPDNGGRFFVQKSAQSLNFQGGASQFNMG